MLRSTALRRALAVLLLAPAVSLLASHALSAAIAAAGLAGSLPVGLHTYVPAVDVVDVRLLELGGLLLALPGLALVAGLAGGRAGPRPAPRLDPLLRAGGLAVAAQLALYLAQALLVAQVHGLPDAAPAAVLALALQGLVTLTGAVSLLWSARAWAGSGAAAPAPHPCRRAASGAPGWRSRTAPAGFVILDAPRRGPPPSPSPTHA